MAALLWGRVLDEVNALFDVALQSLDASVDQLLLLLICVTEDVEGFLGTGWLDIKLVQSTGSTRG